MKMLCIIAQVVIQSCLWSCSNIPGLMLGIVFSLCRLNLRSSSNQLWQHWYVSANLRSSKFCCIADSCSYRIFDLTTAACSLRLLSQIVGCNYYRPLTCMMNADGLQNRRSGPPWIGLLRLCPALAGCAHTSGSQKDAWWVAQHYLFFQTHAHWV